MNLTNPKSSEKAKVLKKHNARRQTLPEKGLESKLTLSVITNKSKQHDGRASRQQGWRRSETLKTFKEWPG